MKLKSNSTGEVITVSIKEVRLTGIMKKSYIMDRKKCNIFLNSKHSPEKVDCIVRKVEERENGGFLVLASYRTLGGFWRVIQEIDADVIEI